ncbi:hypothetical protein FOZ61_009583 [Perkinsus olseni]|nr:hypothetical protein FOZ61_009583 [Perkinsus olseni]
MDEDNVCLLDPGDVEPYAVVGPGVDPDSEEHDLTEPRAVQMSNRGTVLWVCDSGNHRLLRVDRSTFTVTSVCEDVGLRWPEDICICADSSVAVADTDNDRVLVYTPRNDCDDGGLVQEVLGPSSGPIQLRGPGAVASDPVRKVLYVGDSYNGRIVCCPYEEECDEGSSCSAAGHEGTSVIKPLQNSGDLVDAADTGRHCCDSTPTLRFGEPFVVAENRPCESRRAPTKSDVLLMLVVVVIVTTTRDHSVYHYHYLITHDMPSAVAVTDDGRGFNGQFKKLYRGNVMSQLRKYKMGKIDLDQLEVRSSVPKADLMEVVGLDGEELAHAVELMLAEVNERNRSARRAHNREAHDAEVDGILEYCEDHLPASVPVRRVEESERAPIDWSRLPKHLIPEMMNISLYYHLKRGDYEGAALRINHGKRKRAQIEHMVSLLRSQVRFPGSESPRVKIVDLGGGRGDLALTIAHEFPTSDVRVLDIKEISVKQALYRAEKLGLSHRVHGTVCDLSQYDVSALGFDVAVGLHCCAGLSDVAIDLCERNARHRPTTLIACTCCFGKMKQWFGPEAGFCYPRTPSLDVPLDRYETLCQTAEDDRRGSISRRAKLFINQDRINAAQERSSTKDSPAPRLISAEIVELPPVHSFKNEVLVMTWAPQQPSPGG